MKLIVPFTPHLAYECLELFKCKTSNDWPEIENGPLQDAPGAGVEVF